MELVAYILLVFNIVNLVILLPIIYPVLTIFMSKCRCAMTPGFWLIIVYLAVTIALIVMSSLTHLNVVSVMNKHARMVTVAYFLLTLIFVETATRYINSLHQSSAQPQQHPTCECIPNNYAKWITNITLLRWISVYFLSIILLSAGLYLFVRSETRPFSFPGTRRKTNQ